VCTPPHKGRAYSNADRSTRWCWHPQPTSAYVAKSPFVASLGNAEKPKRLAQALLAHLAGTICRAHAVSIGLICGAVRRLGSSCPNGPKTSAHLDGRPVFAPTREPVVTKAQNVVRHRQGNDLRLDPIAAKRCNASRATKITARPLPAKPRNLVRQGPHGTGSSCRLSAKTRQ